jgi:Transposase, Mutator family
MCILSLRLGFALHLGDEALAFFRGDGDILHVRPFLWWLDGFGVFTMPQRTAVCSIILCICLESELADRWRESHPKVADHVEEHVEECLSCLAFPESHCRRIRTTNAQERLNQEINAAVGW